MKRALQKQLTNLVTLDEISTKVINFLEKIKIAGEIERIGYVSGIVASEGPENIPKNRRQLAQYVDLIKKQYDFPMFSTVDVLTNRVYERLEEMRLPFIEREVKFRSFWVKIISCGHVTDIFMTPRWNESLGAKQEHEAAKKLGLTIHYFMS